MSATRQGVARLRLTAMLLVAVLAPVTAGGCSDSGDDRPPAPASVVTPRPAATFAPLVHLYEGERARPISAAEFVEGSSLTMANEPCYLQETAAVSATRLRIGRDEPAPTLYPDRLGGRRPPYRRRVRQPDCSGHQRRSYATDEHTRPFDPGRPAQLRPHEGFYLDLLTDRLDGTADYRRAADGQLRVSGAPVYHDRRAERVGGRPGMRITYWLLFGLDGYDSGDAAYALINEGDWERVEVLLRKGDGRDRWQPVSVGYRIHGRRRDVPWSSAELASASGERAPTHPVVYAAQGNHAPYPDEGRTAVRHDVDDGPPVRAVDERRACADCPLWRTWKDLRPARLEPWYGYGGAWGAVGPVAQRSGPIGPSPHTR